MRNLIELPIERTIDRSLEDKLIRATKAHAYLPLFLVVRAFSGCG
jgi:hypothetical protein